MYVGARIVICDVICYICWETPQLIHYGFHVIAWKDFSPQCPIVSSEM